MLKGTIKEGVPRSVVGECMFHQKPPSNRPRPEDVGDGISGTVESRVRVLGSVFPWLIPSCLHIRATLGTPDKR
jgi:hypothetical protein